MANPRNKTQWVQAEDTSDSETELPVLRINSKSSHPIQIELKINDKPLQMEVDTGAAVFIISEQTKSTLYPRVSLIYPSVVLCTYTGKAMSVLGEMKVKVEYKDQSHNLTLMVVKGDGLNLFGRDWLQYFQLDWKTIDHLRARTKEFINTLIAAVVTSMNVLNPMENQ